MKTCFVTKSVRFDRTELSICRTGGESRDLEIEHGFKGCFKKMKGTRLIFILVGSEELNKKRKSGTTSVDFWSPELYNGQGESARLALMFAPIFSLKNKVKV